MVIPLPELIKSPLRRKLRRRLLRNEVDPADRNLKQLLDYHRISLVLDVGANSGQYGKRLRKIGYHGRMISFEPQMDAFRELVSCCEKDPLWQAHNLALGREKGRKLLHRALNSASNSFLPVLKRSVLAAPESAYCGQEEVPVESLDCIFDSMMSDSETIFLKLDVQGYEREVLHGAANCLSRIAGIQIELSLVPLYSGAPDWIDLVSFIRRLGMDLVAVENVFTDPISHHLLQIDGLFFRENLSAE